MRSIFVLLTVLVAEQVCFGQVAVTAPNERESFNRLPDGIIKRELTLFTLAGSSALKNDEHPRQKITLKEIPVKICTDSTVYFELRNIVSANLIVSIESDMRSQKKKIKRVRFAHEKYQLILPDSATDELYSPRFCKKEGSKKTIISNSKVFRSEDNSRVYIYMFNGEVEQNYEVTWVIERSKYLTRIVDRVF